jgi:hypothetical protein
MALLHRQPTQISVEAAEKTLVDVWLPMETAVPGFLRVQVRDDRSERDPEGPRIGYLWPHAGDIDNERISL